MQVHDITEICSAPAFMLLVANKLIIIIIIIIIYGCLMSQTPTLWFQASHCSTFRINCDMPSIAV